MEISISGVVMHDKDDARRRNYETFVISAIVPSKFGRKETHVHICNYAISSKGVAHRMLSSEYTSSEKALAAMTVKVKEKLARNRVEKCKLHGLFKSVDKLIDYLVDANLKITIEDEKTIRNHFTKFETASLKCIEAEEFSGTPEEHFESSIAKQLKGKTLEELEEASDFGKTTSAANPNWGMF